MALNFSENPCEAKETLLALILINFLYIGSYFSFNWLFTALYYLLLVALPMGGQMWLKNVFYLKTI